MSTIALYTKRIRRSLDGCSLRLSLGLLMFEEEFCLDLFGFLIALPFLDRWRYQPAEILDSWGVKYSRPDCCIHFNWGPHYKIWWLPWCKERAQEEVQRYDGSWAKKTHQWNGEAPDLRGVRTFPYRYALRNGDVQNVTAIVYVERNRYVWRCFRKLPLFWALWRWEQYLEIEFDGEVGERAGSWKGGCIGTSDKMLPGETAEQTLRRMERERKF